MICDMMSKKMKGVDLGSSPCGVYVDAKARFKHQTLMQDYQELQKVVLFFFSFFPFAIFILFTLKI